MGLMVSTPEKLTMTPINLPNSRLGIAKLCAVVGRSTKVAIFQNTLRRKSPFVFRMLELDVLFQPVGAVILSEAAPLDGKNEMLATMTSFKAVPVGVLRNKASIDTEQHAMLVVPVRVTVI